MSIPSRSSVYTAYVIYFTFFIFGLVPRGSILIVAAALMLWLMRTSIEEGVLFFIQSIPLFVALPLTTSYDNLNLWRPLALLLLIKYLIETPTLTVLVRSLRSLLTRPLEWLTQHATSRHLIILALLGCASLIGAAHIREGILRILYFTNLLFVPVIVWRLLSTQRLTAERALRSISISAYVVIVFGFVQLASTYIVDVYQFMRLWGENIQLRQFGAQWSHIAVWVGNTWLAYYGDQLSLRVFSLFPDSHSFPTYVLLSIPAILSRPPHSHFPKALVIDGRQFGKHLDTPHRCGSVWGCSPLFSRAHAAFGQHQ